MNRHDYWIQFRDANRTAFQQTGLPDPVWTSRDRLFRVLEFGVVEEASADLAALTNEQFMQLEALVNAYEPDWQNLKFPALQRERLRRFGRYA
jgi:hypothetical protein